MNQQLKEIAKRDEESDHAKVRGRRADIYERIILHALTKMNLGRLNLEFPDGERLCLGDGLHGVEADVRVVRESFFKRCVLFGDIGFGEAYIDGDWQTDDITSVVSWFILNTSNVAALSGGRTKTAINALNVLNRLKHLLRPNSVRTSRRNISEHYDLGNDFYRLWLDEGMTYSSALFTETRQSLESAQTAKYDALCTKLKLRRGEHVLEIGTGWGGFACHAVKHYGCRITTVTISEQQFNFARERIAKQNLSDRIDVRLEDYRHVKGKFDKIASIEMMEALGDKYLETFFETVHRLLKSEGVAGFQYITVADSRHAQLRQGVDFIQKHIFPGSLLLSVGRVNQAINRTGDLSPYSLEDMGLSYARTLNIWRERFNARLDAVRALGFNQAFIRKWNYYLSYCEAAFTMRNISVVQAIYARPNNHNF